MTKINDENETCNKCGKPTVPLVGGRKRWCPDCEGVAKEKQRKEEEEKKKKRWNYDFELVEIGSDKDKDADTKPIDIDFDSLFPGSGKGRI